VFAALLCNSRHSLQELLSVGHAESKINLIAIPTTAGTGAEVTPFATVWERALGKKHSLHGVTPTVALLDASLTITLPYEQTIYPALDTMSHALESLWNKHRTTESIKNAQDALFLLCDALPLVQQEPKNHEARKKLQFASMLAGLAIAQTRTALAHAMSYPLTANYGVPHGLACSFTLRAILREVDRNSLNLSLSLIERIEVLLTELCLDKALSHYVNWTQLSSLYKQPLHASRAGNFILNFDQKMLLRILSNSWSLGK
jgi:alcohol dehydrogenase